MAMPCCSNPQRLDSKHNQGTRHAAVYFAYLGGMLTLLSTVHFAGQPFMRAGLPMLIGMAASFALIASLATVAGGWVVAVNELPPCVL